MGNAVETGERQIGQTTRQGIISTEHVLVEGEIQVGKTVRTGERELGKTARTTIITYGGVVVAAIFGVVGVSYVAGKFGEKLVETDAVTAARVTTLLEKRPELVKDVGGIVSSVADIAAPEVSIAKSTAAKLPV